MKMYMPLCVRESGVVRWHLSEGAALKPGDRLATLELDDPSAVTRAEVSERCSACGCPAAKGGRERLAYEGRGEGVWVFGATTLWGGVVL